MAEDTQTAKPSKPEVQEIASIERDINRVFYGTVLRNEDDTLLARGGSKGLKIYDELKRDAHAGAVLAKRKLAVTSRPWEVKPASDSALDKKAADLVQRQLEGLRFNHTRKRLLEATLKGFAVGEVMWERRGAEVWARRVIARDQRRFTFGLDESLRLLTPTNRFEGEVMPPRKFIVHRRGADDDTPFGTGVGGMLFWPVFFKRNTITFWLTFADKFGSPTSKGTYPTGAGKDEQKKLLDALKAISQDAGVIVPEGMTIELLEAARSGSADTYEKLVRYMDEQMSKAVLGETMSTTAASTGLGSNQAGVQNDVRLEVAQDDANELDETLNDTLVKWIVEYNLPGAGLPRIETSFEEPEDLAKRATRDKTLVDMGWEPDEDYMLDTYGEGWHKKATPEPPPPGAPGEPGAPGTMPPPGNEGDAPATFAEGRSLQAAVAQQRAHAQQQAAIDAGAEALAGQWRALVAKPVEQLMSMLDETGDLIQFRERMDELLNQPPDAQAVKTVAQANFAARLMGRLRAAAPAFKPRSK